MQVRGWMEVRMGKDYLYWPRQITGGRVNDREPAFTSSESQVPCKVGNAATSESWEHDDPELAYPGWYSSKSKVRPCPMNGHGTTHVLD